MSLPIRQRVFKHAQVDLAAVAQQLLREPQVRAFGAFPTAEVTVEVPGDRNDTTPVRLVIVLGRDMDRFSDLFGGKEQ